MKKMLSIIIGLSVALLADFSRNSNGIVIDSVTRLQWQDNYSDNGGNVKLAKWRDAIAYCEALGLGGHGDWRLPNFNELYYIADRSKRNSTIDSIFEYTRRNYWSSTTVAGHKYYAWLVHFRLGKDGWDGRDSWDGKGVDFYVRCVRTGE